MPKTDSNQLLEKITKHITTTYNIPPDNIVLSAIGLGEDNYWRWIVPPRIDGCANMSCILKNSAFLIRDNDIPYYYCNDKKKAIEDGKYFYDQRDLVFGFEGSYILWEIDNTTGLLDDIARNNPPRNKIIVSISTYGSKLADCQDCRKVISLLAQGLSYAHQCLI